MSQTLSHGTRAEHRPDNRVGTGLGKVWGMSSKTLGTLHSPVAGGINRSLSQEAQRGGGLDETRAEALATKAKALEAAGEGLVGALTADTVDHLEDSLRDAFGEALRADQLGGVAPDGLDPELPGTFAPKSSRSAADDDAYFGGVTISFGAGGVSFGLGGGKTGSDDTGINFSLGWIGVNIGGEVVAGGFEEKIARGVNPGPDAAPKSVTPQPIADLVSPASSTSEGTNLSGTSTSTTSGATGAGSATSTGAAGTNTSTSAGAAGTTDKTGDSAGSTGAASGGEASASGASGTTAGGTAAGGAAKMPGAGGEKPPTLGPDLGETVLKRWMDDRGVELSGTYASPGRNASRPTGESSAAQTPKPKSNHLADPVAPSLDQKAQRQAFLADQLSTNPHGVDPHSVDPLPR